MTATIDTSAAHVAATRRSLAHEPQQTHHLTITAHATGSRHVLHDVLDLVMLGLVLVFVWFLWPVNWGGTARFIMVQGPSMEPKFHLGDAIIVRSVDDPRPGDVVVFKIPDGQPGHGSYVVHRILAVRDDGTFMTKGDNRDLPDPFTFTADDIVGRPMWTLPQAGRLVMLFANPWFVGGAIGGIALLLLMPWIRNKPAADEDADGDEADGEAASAGIANGPVATARSGTAPAFHELPTQELPAIDVLDRQLSALGVRFSDGR
ncbi:MAG: signal peptidase I [Ilumatobacteraceae bacterium]